MTKTIVIGAGQDGSYMAEYLLENTDHEVVVATRRTSHDNLDNLAVAFGTAVAKRSMRLRVETLDLNDAHSITALVNQEKPDYLINLGGSTFVPDSFNSPAQVMQTNAIALIHLLEAVRQHAPHCRVFSAGSSMQADAKSIYGVSKQAAQGICRVYRESYGLYVVHGILHNHTSPRQSEMFLPRKIAKGVARIARAIKDGQLFEPIELGNLDSAKDFSWAPDFVDGIYKMLNQEPFRRSLVQGEPSSLGVVTADTFVFPKSYTLCSGEIHSVREFVEKAFAVAGIEGEWVFDSDHDKPTPKAEAFFINATAKVTADNPEYVEFTTSEDVAVCINPSFYRPNEVDPIQGDSTPARRELGWAPKVTFDELVKLMVTAELAALGL